MNLTDSHMFKLEKDKIIATFNVFLFFCFFFNLPLAASELHPLGIPNDVCTALDTPTKWVSLFLFTLSISSCCIVYPSSPLWWSINVTDFYQSNPQRQHMHWTEGGGIISHFQGSKHTRGCTPHHLWSTSQLDIKGPLQLKMSVGLECLFFFFSRLQRGWIKA